VCQQQSLQVVSFEIVVVESTNSSTTAIQSLAFPIPNRLSIQCVRCISQCALFGYRQVVHNHKQGLFNTHERQIGAVKFLLFTTNNNNNTNQIIVLLSKQHKKNNHRNRYLSWKILNEPINAVQ